MDTISIFICSYIEKVLLLQEEKRIHRILNVNGNYRRETKKRTKEAIDVILPFKL